MVKIFRDGATVIAMVVMMFIQSWQLSLVFLLIAPIVGIVVLSLQLVQSRQVF